jgi:hypothetical protein
MATIDRGGYKRKGDSFISLFSINMSIRREQCGMLPKTPKYLSTVSADGFARTLSYPEIPRYYTWNNSRKIFCTRKVGQPVLGHDAFAIDALGQVYTVHPSNAECYFLGMHLHSLRGPRSFAELRTVNGEVCQTFREVCQKLGLLEGD